MSPIRIRLRRRGLHVPFARVASRTKFGILERDFPFHGPLLSTLIFGADAARGNTRSHPEHDG